MKSHVSNKQRKKFFFSKKESVPVFEKIDSMLRHTAIIRYSRFSIIRPIQNVTAIRLTIIHAHDHKHDSQVKSGHCQIYNRPSVSSARRESILGLS